MSLHIVFLDSGTLYDIQELDMLHKLGSVEMHHNTDPHLVSVRIEGAHVVITNKVRIEATHMDSKSLKLICVAATGMNNIDLEAAKIRGIEVKNVKDYSTASVAQTTLALALQLHMQVHKYDQFVQSGAYSKHLFFTHLSPSFHDLFGQTWGIIGYGNIGKAVAKLAKALGMQVLAHSVSGNSQVGEVPFVDLDTLLSTADIVSIHVPYRPDTQNLIDEKALALMKPNAILINVARGGIVDELALAKAIDANQIAGAGVDVFSQEPISISNPLLQVKQKDKIILTPHIAWGSVESRKRLVEGIVLNIRTWIDEQKI